MLFVYIWEYFVCCMLFFFFKQKTAYEMRISDWSSDVCSSDLTKRDGLVNNISGPDMATQDRTVARASVLFEPTDWLSNYTVAIYSHRDERPAAQISGSDGAIAPCPINLQSCIYGPAYADEQNGRAHV